MTLRLIGRLLEEHRVDGDVVDVYGVGTAEVEVPGRRVPHLNAAHSDVCGVIYLEKVWSLVVIFERPFALPPLITESVEDTFSLDREVMHLFELEQGVHITAQSLSRPLLVVLGGL